MTPATLLLVAALGASPPAKATPSLAADAPARDPLPEGLTRTTDPAVTLRAPTPSPRLPEDRTSVRGRLRFLANQLAEPLRALPGWGQFYNRQEPKGWAFLGVTGALLVTSVVLHTLGVAVHDRYSNLGRVVTEPSPDFEGLLKQEEGFYFARNAAVYVTAGVWIYNVIDAFVNGKTYDPARAGD